MRVFERGEKVGWLLGMTGFVYIIACYSLLYCWGTHGYGYRKKCVGVQGTCSSRILSSLRKYIVYIQWSTYSFSFPFFSFTLFPFFSSSHEQNQLDLRFGLPSRDIPPGTTYQNGAFYRPNGRFHRQRTFLECIRCIQSRMMNVPWSPLVRVDFC